MKKYNLHRVLKTIPGEKKEPLLSGLLWVCTLHLTRYHLMPSKVRDEAAVVRQEGAKRNGSERVG